MREGDRLAARERAIRRSVWAAVLGSITVATLPLALFSFVVGSLTMADSQDWPARSTVTWASFAAVGAWLILAGCSVRCGVLAVFQRSRTRNR